MALSTSRDIAGDVARALGQDDVARALGDIASDVFPHRAMSLAMCQLSPPRAAHIARDVFPHRATSLAM